MRVERGGVVGSAEITHADSAYTEPVGLIREGASEIQRSRAGGTRAHDCLRDLRSDFITGAANSDTAMHYDCLWGLLRPPCQGANPRLEDTACRSTPSGMQDPDGSGVRLQQVDRDAVGNGDGEEHVRLGCDVTVQSLQHRETRGGVDVDSDLAAVGLPAHDDAVEASQFRRQRFPEHLIGARVGQSEVQDAVTRCHAGHDAVPLTPFEDLEPRNRGVVEGMLLEMPGASRGHASVRSARSMWAPMLRRRASIRS